MVEREPVFSACRQCQSVCSEVSHSPAAGVKCRDCVVRVCCRFTFSLLKFSPRDVPRAAIRSGEYRSRARNIPRELFTVQCWSAREVEKLTEANQPWLRIRSVLHGGLRWLAMASYGKRL